MNRNSANSKAFTLVEVIVLGAVAIAAVILLCVGLMNRQKVMRMNCARNLKQVTLAFYIWAGDNGDKFPMSATNASGALMFPTPTSATAYFQVMSNAMADASMLLCPADRKPAYASNFTSDFNSSHISYFIGLDANEKFPTRFLAGDNNLTNGTKLVKNILTLTSKNPAGWTKERHNHAGNVALADGSVQQWSDSALQQALQNTGLATNRLVMP